MMTTGKFIIFFFILLTSSTIAREEPGRDDFYYDVFPPDFKWGMATAGYNVEGAWNLDGKGPHIWDVYTHQSPSPVRDGSTADVACDSYHLYKEDVALVKKMGGKLYRFSISWSRLLPDGTPSSLNQDGVDYYNRLIDEVVTNGIEPVVTLYHWDLPQNLMDITGGWQNESLAYHFSDYAKVAFGLFGHRVKQWITFNEIWIFCQLGYAYGSHPPLIVEPAEGSYQCAHNAIKAHGLAYRIYESQFKPQQHGLVGMTLASDWNEPMDGNKAEDVEASHRASKFNLGWIAHPLYYGEYPPIMRKLIDEKSETEGRNQSRLPNFDENWTGIIKGTMDFMGLNHYSSNYVNKTEGGLPSLEGDSDTAIFIDPEWPGSAADWLKVVPWGFRRLLKTIAMQYGNPPIYITENGFADKSTDGLDDPDRINYFRLYINEMLKAVRIDGVNVKGYIGWALIDNFEWLEGYTQRFGVHYIDFAGGNLTRVPKESAKFLTNVFSQNGFPPPETKSD